MDWEYEKTRCHGGTMPGQHPGPGVDPVADLVNFLKDQDALHRETGGTYVIYDPVVRVREERIKIGNGSRIDSFVKLEGGEGLVIGRYVHIASFAHVGIGGGRTFIGDFAAIASGARIVSGSNMVDAYSLSAAAPPGLQRVERKTTTIGRQACVFTNATVLPGVTLGEGAVLAAGAVATRDVPAWEVYAGVPARFIAKRVLKEGA